jgi:hypothetical protein
MRGLDRAIGAVRRGVGFIRKQFTNEIFVGALYGLAAALIVNLVWQRYTKPKLRVDASIVITTRNYHADPSRMTWSILAQDVINQCNLFEVNAIRPWPGSEYEDSTRVTWRAVIDNHGSSTITNLRFLLRTPVKGNLQVHATPTIDVETHDRSYAPISPREMLIKVPEVPPRVRAVLTVSYEAPSSEYAPNQWGILTVVGSSELSFEEIRSKPIGVVEAIATEWEIGWHSPVYLGVLPMGFSNKFIVENAGDPNFTKDTTCATPETPWAYSLDL